MARMVLAIVLAPVVWGVVMFGGNALIFLVYPEAADGSVAPVGYLLMALAGSVIYSLVTGFACAAIAGSSLRKVGIGAGVAVLLVGIGVQLSYWNLLPVWYHVSFLVLLMPCTFAGAALFAGRQAAAADGGVRT